MDLLKQQLKIKSNIILLNFYYFIMKSINDNIYPFFIYIGERCNNNCLFCSEYGIKYNISLMQIKEKIDFAKSQNLEINFMGREPTLSNNLIPAIKYAKDKSIKSISITTNGRYLSYFDYCMSLKDAGINFVIISIHGGTSEVHDRITQVPGSFSQLLTGLDNLKKLDIKFMTNTVISRINESDIEQVIKLLTKYKPNKINLVNMILLKKNLTEKIVPKISLIALKIKNILKKYPKQNIGLVGFPICYFENYKNLISIYEYMDENFAEIPRCKKCEYYPTCGVFKNYVKIYGSDEFK